MITIKQKSSINLKTKEALFVSFSYDLSTLKKIKSLPKRYYVKETQEWEVPIRNINDIISLFSDQELKIEGKVKTGIKEKVTNMVHFKGIENDYKFKTKPFQHQLECFNYAKTHNKFLLGDDMGLGKTKQSLDIATFHKGQFKHCLIVCGVNSLKWNWLEEIKIHTDEKGLILGSYINSKYKLDIGGTKDKLRDLNNDIPAYFLITNIETLRNKDITEKLHKMCLGGEIGMVIIDEAHKIKSPSSLQGKAIHQLNSYYKIAMTGTPIMNNPIDAYNILKWLDVEKHPFYQFKNRYCVTGGFGGYEIIGYKNLQELQNLLSENMIRRKKEDVLDLPEKIFNKSYVELGEVQKSLYLDMKNSIEDNIDKVKVAPNPLSLLIRLRQATATCEILSTAHKESAKIDRLKEILDTKLESNQKVIVFTTWTSVTDILKRELKSYKPVFITGQTKDNDRQDIKNKFQNDINCNVIIGTIGAMGTGITLNKASTVVFLDEPWNMALKNQCIDRAYRIGTKNNVHILTIIAKNTIDERINDIVENKGIMADAITDGDWTKLNKSKLVDYLMA